MLAGHRPSVGGSNFRTMPRIQADAPSSFCWAFSSGPFGASRLLTGAAKPTEFRWCEVDVDLLGLEILVEAPGPEFAAPTALLVASPGRFVEGGVVTVEPRNPGAELFEHAEAFGAV